MLLALLAVVLASFASPASATAATGHGDHHRRHHKHHHHHHHKHHHHKHHHHKHHHGAATAGAGQPTADHDASSAPTAVERQIATRVLVLLNRERAAHHLAPLRVSRDLEASARAHDLAMARTNDMSHQVPGEEPLGSRETAAGYDWTWAGENIGWNSQMTSSGVLALETMMYDERPPDDGHRLNILSTHYVNIGVDVLMDPAHQKVWLTTDFGRH